ncbi:class F sortase [Ornithinimicrobium pratense]|uniref:Sortase n=1 Tax=Ornithinimicrobium pratense TaxID=2593973 RepID=A0A5J6V1K1_9MICO|nr:class F sortase [Ornithinimicrobium pratense]QFG67468.1 sortase [Ornithinimicrobium pratense]
MATSQNARARRARGTAGLALLVAVVLVGALIAFWGWRGGVPTVADQVQPPTHPATTSAPVATSVPAEQERPTAVSPGRTSGPAPSPSAAPTFSATTEPAPTVTDPAPAEVSEGPVHVRITRAADVLVDAPVALTQLNEREELNPPSGVVGWYGPPDWATVPGELSAYPGVLAGHTTHGGSRDVFYRLGEVRAGDVVTIGYADGSEAVFEADMDALSVPKNDVTEKADAEYAWVWRLAEPGRTVSIFSCDPAQGLDLTGHSVNNWVVQATLRG